MPSVIMVKWLSAPGAIFFLPVRARCWYRKERESVCIWATSVSNFTLVATQNRETRKQVPTYVSASSWRYDTWSSSRYTIS